ncbi:hypothetical protein ACFXA3_30690, partial [Streptomyces sp. NPDC059456]
GGRGGRVRGFNRRVRLTQGLPGLTRPAPPALVAAAAVGAAAATAGLVWYASRRRASALAAVATSA